MPAGQLADDEHVDAGEQLGPERRRRDERRLDGDRAQVGEQAEPAAQREERLLRAGPAPSGRTTSARRPRRAGSRRPRRRPSTSSSRMATPYASIAAPPTTMLRPVDREPEPARRRRRRRAAPPRRPPARPRRPGSSRSRYVVAPSVTGASRPGAATTNATETPLISAPWSLLTATR